MDDRQDTVDTWVNENRQKTNVTHWGAFKGYPHEFMVTR